VTLVLRNGLGIITTDGDYHVVFEDPREDVLKSFEEKKKPVAQQNQTIWQWQQALHCNLSRALLSVAQIYAQPILYRLV